MNKPIFWPVAGIFLGVIILMINLGYLPAMTVKYWPVLLVLWGLAKIASIDEKKRK